METGPLPPKEPFWGITPLRATAWRLWAGEMVVYDDVSGDTLKLDPLMTVIFQHLMEGPSQSANLVSHLAEVLEVDNDPKLQQLTEMGLNRLAGCGLISASPEPASVPSSP